MAAHDITLEILQPPYILSEANVTVHHKPLVHVCNLQTSYQLRDVIFFQREKYAAWRWHKDTLCKEYTPQLNYVLLFIIIIISLPANLFGRPGSKSDGLLKHMFLCVTAET